MSERRSLYQIAKDNWAQLTVIFVVLAFLDLVAIDWRVRARLAETDLATDTNIVDINTSVADNKRTGEENAEDITQNRRNVEAAFRRLMGMDPPEPEDP